MKLKSEEFQGFLFLGIKPRVQIITTGWYYQARRGLSWEGAGRVPSLLLHIWVTWAQLPELLSVDTTAGASLSESSEPSAAFLQHPFCILPPSLLLSCPGVRD